MARGKEDLIFKAYVLNILRALTDRPKRFSELQKDVRTKRTLAIKLDKLLDADLIELVPIKTTSKRYANFYRITDKGKKLLKNLGNLFSSG